MARKRHRVVFFGMRKLLTFAAVVAVVACGDSPLAPVQTVDGSWSGLANGYSLSLVMAQNDTFVSGSTFIANVGGTSAGTVTGTFVYPNLHVTLSFPGVDPVKYDGTMSQAEAKIFGRLNGAGIINVEVDVRKK